MDKRQTKIQEVRLTTGQVVREWDSISGAAQDLGISYQGVQSRILRGTLEKGTYLCRVSGPRRQTRPMGATNKKTGEVVQAESVAALASLLTQHTGKTVHPATLANRAAGPRTRRNAQTLHLEDWVVYDL